MRLMLRLLFVLVALWVMPPPATAQEVPTLTGGDLGHWHTVYARTRYTAPLGLGIGGGLTLVGIPTTAVSPGVGVILLVQLWVGAPVAAAGSLRATRAITMLGGQLGRGRGQAAWGTWAASIPLTGFGLYLSAIAAANSAPFYIALGLTSTALGVGCLGASYGLAFRQRKLAHRTYVGLAADEPGAAIPPPRRLQIGITPAFPRGRGFGAALVGAF